MARQQPGVSVHTLGGLLRGVLHSGGKPALWLGGMKLAVKTVKRSGWEQLSVDVLDRSCLGVRLKRSQTAVALGSHCLAAGLWGFPTNPLLKPEPDRSLPLQIPGLTYRPWETDDGILLVNWLC